MTISGYQRASAAISGKCSRLVIISGHQWSSEDITCAADWPPSAADRVRYVAPSTARATRPSRRQDQSPSSAVPPDASSTRHARLSPSPLGRPRAPQSYLLREAIREVIGRSLGRPRAPQSYLQSISEKSVSNQCAVMQVRHHTSIGREAISMHSEWRSAYQRARHVACRAPSANQTQSDAISAPASSTRCR